MEGEAKRHLSTHFHACESEGDVALIDGNDRASNKLGNRRVILQIHNLGLCALPGV